MRIFSISPSGVTESATLPTQAPDQGYVWIACARTEFETLREEVQATLQALTGTTLVDLHISDLLNKQLPSRFDYTSMYDLLVFRRLSSGDGEPAPAPAPTGEPPLVPRRRGGPPVLRRIDTSPIGFAVFDQVLLTVHPPDCAARDAYATRLLAAASASAETRAANVDPRLGGARLPASPSDLMLRIVNQIVDGYLALRRDLSRQLDHWQAELLDPRTRFSNWSALLEARMALHQLDDICEDQRTAVLDWTEAVKGWPVPDNADARHEHELLMVRSRDVLEHIERVVRHVTRLEHNAETAVQMHFSAQGNRTNNIMRTLTALTAIFLPLNLITGFFGMNFETFPFIHSSRLVVDAGRDGLHRRDDGPAVLAQALPGAHRALKARASVHTNGGCSCSATITRCTEGRASMRCRYGPRCGRPRAGTEAKLRVQRHSVNT
jgi:magnesium transporter